MRNHPVLYCVVYYELQNYSCCGPHLEGRDMLPMEIFYLYFVPVSFKSRNIAFVSPVYTSKMGQMELCNCILVVFSSLPLNITFHVCLSDDLFVKRTGIHIWSNEVWGSLRGLETLSQIIFKGTNQQVRNYCSF